MIFAGTFGEQEDVFGRLRRKAEEQLPGALRRNAPCLEVGAVIGIKVLIDATERNGRVDAFKAHTHVREPERLHCLVKCLRRSERHLRADTFYFPQFVAPSGFGFGFGEPSGLGGDFFREGNHPLARDFRRAVKIRFSLRELGAVAFDSRCEDSLVVWKEVPDAPGLVDEVVGRVELFERIPYKTANTRVKGAKHEIAEQPVRTTRVNSPGGLEPMLSGLVPRFDVRARSVIIESRRKAPAG